MKNYYSVTFELYKFVDEVGKGGFITENSIMVSSINGFDDLFDFETDIAEHIESKKWYKELENEYVYHVFIHGELEINNYLSNWEYQEYDIEVICEFDTVSTQNMGKPLGDILKN